MDQQNSGGGAKGWSWLPWAVLIVLVALVVIFILWEGPSAEAPTIGTGDTTSEIAEQLDSIDVGDLDAELQAIDADLGQL
jgi:hypothetical protein